MTDKQKDGNIAFQAEVQQLLNLVIHSLYSERDVFLRELISNASDACGRLRFESMTDSSMREGEGESTIDIELRKGAKNIVIRDNGIGMTHDEVVENIGTIARSGTKRFVESLSGEQSEDSRLIGQFGVGFYSAFMVAEQVVLKTRKAGQPPESGVVWSSDGVNGFTIDSETIDEHGTEITLTLRNDAKEFLDDQALRRTIKKYSDHVSLPIRLRSVVRNKPGEWETANEAAAIWTRRRADISEEEYGNFYSTLTYGLSKPLARLHNRVEGKLEYTVLLFIPDQAPFDLFDRDRREGVKLYVRRIFIMDDAEHLLPAYLRFVKGVVDSDDLPLNVSREFLQKNKQIDRIKAGTTKKILAELKRLAAKEPDKYRIFWAQFGQVFKEGIVEDQANAKAISELFRFATTKSDAETVSLDDYVGHMSDKQDAIYYLTAESRRAAASSPHLEVFRKHDIEVLLLTDPIDEWVAMHLHEYDGKPLKSIVKGDLSLEAFEEKKDGDADSTVTADIAPLIERFKEALADRATDVRASTRLTDSPSCLVGNEYDISSNMRRILEASGQSAPSPRPILEINPDHPLIQNLAKQEDGFEDWAHVLFDQAALSEGGSVENPADYIRRVNALLAQSTGEAPSPIITL